MVRKKVGLARPVRKHITIDGERGMRSYVDALQEAVLSHKDMTLVRVHTDVVRHLVAVGNRSNPRRTHSWILRRTFFFE